MQWHSLLIHVLHFYSDLCHYFQLATISIACIGWRQSMEHFSPCSTQTPLWTTPTLTALPALWVSYLLIPADETWIDNRIGCHSVNPSVLLTVSDNACFFRKNPGILSGWHLVASFLVSSFSSRLTFMLDMPFPEELLYVQKLKIFRLL